MIRKVFVLSPHPDDAEVCCGGTIARLVEEGAMVYNIIFSKSDERKEETRRAATVLGITQCVLFEAPIRNLNKYRQEILDKLIKLKETHKPDLVIIPSSSDVHQDHKVVYEEGLRAFKQTTILGFEALWNNMSFDNKLFVKLKESHVAKKIKAVLCYKSQSDKTYMKEDYIKNLASVRGVQAGTDNAEMFSMIRGVI